MPDATPPGSTEPAATILVETAGSAGHAGAADPAPPTAAGAPATARPRSPQRPRTGGRPPASRRPDRPRGTAGSRRIPAYRWRMMVALAVVVTAGFALGMLLSALG